MAEEKEVKDVGIWVGSQFYSKRQKYIDESLVLGCCRKVPRLLEGIVPGESKCYLFHKEVKEPGTKKKKPKDHQAVIFGYFVIDGYVACDRKVAISRWETKRGDPVFAMGVEARAQIPSRGCGDLDPPSVYIVGPDDATAQKGFRESATGLLGPENRIQVFDKPIRTWMKHFKGLMFIDDIEDYRK